MVDQVMTTRGSRLRVLALWCGAQGEHSRLLEEMRRRGFVGSANGQIYELEGSPGQNKKHSIEVMVDRLSGAGRD